MAEKDASQGGAGWWLALPSLLVLVLSVSSLISGQRTLFFRDIGNFHLPVKYDQVESYRAGELPYVDLGFDGRPALGNPNTLPFYPSNLLYALAPFWWAFNAHFWLHLLLAAFAATWMARTWGLRWVGCWFCGLSYATSGFFLVSYGFYNLVAGAALAPLLLGAARRVVDQQDRGRAWLWWSVVLLIALLLLAGDPLVAAVALLGVLVTTAFRSSEPGNTQSTLWRFLGVGSAVLCGVLVALPQYVEMLRILPSSVRGAFGYGQAGLVVGGVGPKDLLDWLVPFFWGRPTTSFWALRLFQGELPLFSTLHPGLLVLALVGVSGRPRAAAQKWAWWLIGIGAFVSLGVHNPIVLVLHRLPFGSLFRFPAKFWLLGALGMSFLAGTGADRLLTAGGVRLLRRALLVLLLAEVVLAAVVAQGRGSLVSQLGAGLTPERTDQVWLFWLSNALLAVVVISLFLALTPLLRRRPRPALALVLCLHTTIQLLWLAPTMVTDRRSAYRQPPVLGAYLEPGALIVQGQHNELIEPAQLPQYPDNRLLWVQRWAWDTLSPFSGAFSGIRYALVASPDGLSGSWSKLLSRFIKRGDDATLVRVLRALGVDGVVAERPLADPDGLLRLRAEYFGFGSRVYLYGLGSGESTQRLRIVGDVYLRPSADSAMEMLASTDFDPSSAVVLPGEGSSRSRGAPGSVSQLSWSQNQISARITAPNNAVAVLRREYSPIYRATLDGRPAPLVVANICRLGISVPPGEHELRVWVDRRPFLWSLGGPLLGLLGLWGWVRIDRRRLERLERVASTASESRRLVD